MTYPVYTYYDGVYEDSIEPRDTDALAEQRSLISIWKRSWAKRGWFPQVLTIADAKRHPLFDLITKKLELLPTANAKRYEMACYHRWLAVAARGGGFMSDYDVMNYSFEPRQVPADLMVYEAHVELDHVTPSLVAGTQFGFSNAIALFVTSDPAACAINVNDKPHTSDMILLQSVKLSGMYAIAPIVKQYGQIGWDAAPVVHFSHESTQHTNRTQCSRTARPI